MRTPLVAAAVAAAIVVPAAAVPAHAARPAAPFQCPVTIRVTHDSGTRSGPSATHAPFEVTAYALGATVNQGEVARMLARAWLAGDSGWTAAGTVSALSPITGDPFYEVRS